MLCQGQKDMAFSTSDTEEHGVLVQVLGEMVRKDEGQRNMAFSTRNKVYSTSLGAERHGVLY
jgi:hypothetical protein